MHTQSSQMPFSVRVASTSDEKEAVFQFRHRIYCEELGYEAVRENGMETDDADQHAIHVMAVDNDSGNVLGVTRLITLVGRPGALLPMEKVCGQQFVEGPAGRARVAEVSRFAIAAEMRRRKGEDGQPVTLQSSDFGSEERHRFPVLKAALFVGAVTAAEELGIQQILMLTTPLLARFIKMAGVSLECLGAGVDWRG